MGFRLAPSETPEQTVRRIAAEQLDTAIAGLASADDRDGAVHAARKSCKRLRALVRLARDELGEKVYRRENDALRDAARTLAARRDATVVERTFDELLTHANDPSVYRGVRAHVTFDEVPTDGSLADAVERLRAVRERVAGWALAQPDWTAFAPGLHRIYRQGRHRWRAARDEPTGEALHEWRKSVKYLWHAVEVLSPAWPGVLDALADSVHDLADTLGDDHDLLLLAARLDADTTARTTPPELFTLLESRRRDLQREAFSLGRRIYAEKPKVFVARMGSAFEAWRADAAAVTRPG